MPMEVARGLCGVVADFAVRALDGWQVFYLVPVIGICFNIFPVNNSFWFALAFTLYIFMIQVRGLPSILSVGSRMSASLTAAAGMSMHWMCSADSMVALGQTTAGMAQPPTCN